MLVLNSLRVLSFKIMKNITRFLNLQLISGKHNLPEKKSMFFGLNIFLQPKNVNFGTPCLSQKHI